MEVTFLVLSVPLCWFYNRKSETDRPCFKDSEAAVRSIYIQVILGLPSSCSHAACTKMAGELEWVLTHFQLFHSHSSQGCITEKKQDSVTHSVYSQQGGAHSAARLALGCGKETHGKAKASGHSGGWKWTRHTHTSSTNAPSKTMSSREVTHSDSLPDSCPCNLLDPFLATCSVLRHSQHTPHVRAIWDCELLQQWRD